MRLTAKSTCRDAWSLAAAEVLAQAEAALWLLCEFGSCGSKARKGFGSLALEGNNMQIAAVDKCRFAAAELRGKLGLSNRFDPSHVQSAALGPLSRPGVSRSSHPCRTDACASRTMDHQAVAQDFATIHKTAAGLPRRSRPEKRTDEKPGSGQLAAAEMANQRDLNKPHANALMPRRCGFTSRPPATSTWCGSRSLFPAHIDESRAFA